MAAGVEFQFQSDMDLEWSRNLSQVRVDWDEVIERIKAGWCKRHYHLTRQPDGQELVCLLGAGWRTLGYTGKTVYDEDLGREVPIIRTPSGTDPVIGHQLGPIIIEMFRDRVQEYLDDPRHTMPRVVSIFNDHPDTSRDDVIAVCEKARAKQDEVEREP